MSFLRRESLPNVKRNRMTLFLLFSQGRRRMAHFLNLKYLNKFVEYKHFNMESLEDVFKIIKKNAWMASVALKDTFFTIPVHILRQKYFKFEWFN